MSSLGLVSPDEKSNEEGSDDDEDCLWDAQLITLAGMEDFQSKS
jgi:hypothetical protein